MTDDSYSNWYKRNKEAFNKRRREKYKKDPEYRSRMYKPEKSVHDLKPENEVYTVTEACKTVGKNASTLWVWEKEGLIPSALQVKGRKYYTAIQVELLSELAKVRVRGRYSKDAYASKLEDIKNRIALEWDSMTEQVLASWAFRSDQEQ